MIEGSRICNPEQSKIRFFAYIVALYFLLAPFEDMLNLGFGTILKYIALFLGMLIIVPLITGEIKINFNDPLIVIPFLLIAISWSSMLWTANLDVTISRNVAYTLLPLFFVIINMYNFNKNEVNLIKISVVLSLMMLVCYVLLNYKEFMILSYSRFTLNEENDPNNLAAHIIMPLFFTIINLTNDNRIVKIFSFIMVIFSMLALLLTGSRGAMLSVIIGLMYLFFLNIKKINIKYLVILFFCGIIIFYFINKYLPQDSIQRLFTIDSYISDTEGYTSRSGIWKNIFNFILPVMPIIGYGSGVAAYVLAGVYGYLKGVHNTYLNMIIEYGFIALPIFIFFIYNLYRKLKLNNKQKYISILISMLIIIFFLDSYAKKFFWNTLMILAIVAKEE